MIFNVVGVSGYRGAAWNLKKLDFTNYFVGASFAEVRSVAGVQILIIAGDLNAEPTLILSFSKGIAAGLWVDFEASFAGAGSRGAFSYVPRSMEVFGLVPGGTSSMSALRLLQL